MMQMAEISTKDYQPVFQTDGINNSTQRSANITQCLGDGRYQLTEGIEAVCAVSCVIEPQPGDTVLCYTSCLNDSQQAETYILAILHRLKSDTASLTVPNCDNLKISQPSIQCHAKNSLELGCLETIKLTSARGNVEMRAQNLIQTVVGSIIESARERISNADFIQFCASFLTRMHSSQTVMTADSDIKIDAERVNLG